MTVLVDRPTATDAGVGTWTTACNLDRLAPGRGVAVLLPGGVQAALFLLADQTLAAVGNIDPFGHAAVMSRGITGDRRGEPTVASPLGKQVFSLRDGRCLDDAGGAGAQRPGGDPGGAGAQRPGGDPGGAKALCVYDVRVIDGCVEVRSR